MRHIGPQEKLAELRELGARVYVWTLDGALPGPGGGPHLTNLAIVEYLTFMEVMAGSDIHLFVQ